jgi:hypothetical protein
LRIDVTSRALGRGQGKRWRAIVENDHCDSAGRLSRRESEGFWDIHTHEL